MKWRYENPEMFYYSTDVPAPSNRVFGNKWLLIIQGALRVSRFYSWDGATCAPDFAWVKTPSMLHDAIYQFAEDIARCWGCSVFRVLRFGDRVFLEAMQKHGAPPWGQATYYGAVTVAGYVFHQVMRLVKFKAIKL